MNVLYIVSGFPVLSETFIRDELLAHLDAGIEVSVIAWSAPPESEGAWDDLSTRLRPYVNYAGGASRTRQLFELGGAISLELASLGPNHSLSAFLKGCRSKVGGRLSAYRSLKVLQGLRAPPDIIHCHFGYNSFGFAAAKELGFTNSKLVTTFHGVDLSSLIATHGPRTYEKLFRWGDLFLPVSEFWKDRLTQLGCDPSRIVVHRMGIDCSACQLIERHKTDGPVSIVTVGRLVEKKGHCFTLEALGLLSRRRPDIAWKLDLAGGGPDQDLLKQIASDQGIDDFVKFHGPLSHEKTLALMRGGTIFVLPSVTASDGDMEGIPVVLMEAAAMGMPIVSTYHSGIPELVRHEISGLLSRERDVEALSHNLETMIDNPDVWPGFGRAGRRRIEQDYSRPHQSHALREQYQNLIGGQNNPAASL